MNLLKVFCWRCELGRFLIYGLSFKDIIFKNVFYRKLVIFDMWLVILKKRGFMDNGI